MRIDTTRTMSVADIIRNKMMTWKKYHDFNMVQRQAILGIIFTGVPFPVIYGKEDREGVTMLEDNGIIEFLSDFIDGKISVDTYGYYKAIDPMLQARLEDKKIKTIIVQPPTTESDSDLMHNRLIEIYTIILQ